MSNIIDYLKWRGDLSFTQFEPNEVDNLILARLSYLPLGEIELEEKETIKSIANKMKNVDQQKYRWKDDIKLIQILGKTERYKDIYITDFIEEKALDEEKQFAAITILLPNDEIYVSFIGTDLSIVGWKEDFNLSFMSDIPSQKDAVKYLENVASKYESNIRIVGHSKGGNLAIYCGVFCDDSIKQRIIEIVNIDGPGFDKSIISKEQYKKILNKVKTYIPQNSIIGRLLEHGEECEIVKSNQKGIMQHDIYSWEVQGKKLIRIPKMERESEIIDTIIRDWLDSTTNEQRKNFVNIIYEIVATTKVSTVTEFKNKLPQKLKQILDSYKNVDEKDKKEIENMVKLLLSSTKKALIK